MEKMDNEKRIPPVDTRPEEQPVPGWMARMQKRFPDREFPDAEAAEKEFYEDYDKTMDDYGALREDNARMINLLQENPEFAQVFALIRDGMPLRVALARVIDFDAARPQEGDPDYEDFMREAGEFKKRQAEVAEHRKRIEENQARSRVEIDDFFEKVGADDEEQNGFADFLQGLFDDVFEGNMGKVVLGKLWQAYKYNEDMEAAYAAGEVAGRNETIETRRARAKATDGLPDAGSGTGAPAKPRRRIIDTDSWGSR